MARLKKEDITRWRGDKNFMFEWQELYLTSERKERVRYYSCHEVFGFSIWRDWGAGIIFGPRSFAGQDHLRARIIFGPGSFAGQDHLRAYAYTLFLIFSIVSL